MKLPGLKIIICLSCFIVLLPYCLTAVVRADDLDEQINEIKKKISESQAQQKTLASAIAYLDDKIELTTVLISQTEQEIKLLEEEIDKLTLKIGRLNESLETASELLLLRIIETYKKGKADPLYLFLTADGFSQFMSRYQYLKIVQAHDKQLLYQMEQTRFNYDSQKTLKEKKQEEKETLVSQLERQNLELDQQKQSKKILLEETKGKEVEYQKILARLRAEKAKLAGAGLFGKPAEFKVWTDANYYFNQTDERWAMDLIGGGVFYDPADPSFMWKYGCAVTSMAMVLKKSGVDIDPKRLAAQPIYLTDLIAWQDVPSLYGGKITVKGHGYGGYPNWNEIDDYLEKGKWVIVYASDRAHYVVLLSKEGSDYKIHDPYFGNELSFNSKYSQEAVDEMVIYER
jgi:peptidoglycan hydrolase CwlO-like protein